MIPTACKKSNALAKTLAFTNLKLGFPDNLKKYQKDRKRKYTKGPKFEQYHNRRRAKFKRTVHLDEAKLERSNAKHEAYEALLNSQLKDVKRKKKLLIAKLRFCEHHADRLRILMQINYNKLPSSARRGHERIKSKNKIRIR